MKREFESAVDKVAILAIIRLYRILARKGFGYGIFETFIGIQVLRDQ